MLDKTCFMLIANDAIYLQRTLSSRLFEFAYRCIFSSVELGKNGYQYNKHALIKLPIFLPGDNERRMIAESSVDELDEIVFSLYDIDKKEVEYIDAG